MFPFVNISLSPIKSLLRTSGDVSAEFLTVGGTEEFAPHERRCFLIHAAPAGVNVVCSARAEMFLSIARALFTSASLLRTSGDVSIRLETLCLLLQFAPHERRCFCGQHRQGGGASVCSARAEMFPSKKHCHRRQGCLLRTSGDVSYYSM